MVPQDYPRVIIEAVQPQIDCGRFPIKRVVGEKVTVTADIYKEGHDKLAAVLKVRVADEVVEPNLGYLSGVLGENLAGQVDSWVMEQRLGYYPSLDFFRDKPQVVDPALLLLIDEMARFGEEYTRRELRRRLRGGFSHVDVERIQVEAFAMPRILPSQPKSYSCPGFLFNPFMWPRCWGRAGYGFANGRTVWIEDKTTGEIVAGEKW